MQNEIPASPATNPQSPNRDHDGPLFPLGRTVATPGALALCEQHNISPLSLIARHHRGDFGDLCDDDLKANESALFEGQRLLSAFNIGGQEKLYVITEWDRSLTTILKASEY